MSSSSRGNPSMGDVLRTTVVLGLVILGVFFIGKFVFSSEPENPTSEAEYLLAASGVEDVAGFDPLVPPTLNEGWRSTVADFDGNRWRLVVTTEAKKFISYEQARVSARELLMTSAVEPSRGPDVEFATHTWSVGEDESGNRAYFREEGELVHMVISSASEEVLRDYVSSLVPFSTLD